MLTRGSTIIWLFWLTIFIISCGVQPAETATSSPTHTRVEVPIATPTEPPPSATIPALTPPTTKISTSVSTTTPSQEPAAELEGPQLRMVLIKAKSSLEVKQLRQMGLDIVRVQAVASNQTPTSKETLLETEFIVAAVVPVGMLAKLKAMGFEITEVP